MARYGYQDEQSAEGAGLRGRVLAQTDSPAGTQAAVALQNHWERAVQELWGVAAPPGDSEQAWAERFQGEARFLAALIEAGIGGIDPSLVDQAIEHLRDSLQSGERWSSAVPAAESMLLPAVGPVAQSFVIHLVGHAHIDMNWLWDWPETVRVSRDTFRTMDQLMAEEPDFRFSQSQASVYIAMQELYPEIFERIRERQRQGRWEVTASTWVEHDANMASGESIARQLLYAKRYFARELGVPPADVPLVWQPDTFGHPFTIPGILVRAGIRYYYYCRGGHLGPWLRLFWWEGPDGSRVLAFHDNDLWYNGPVRAVDAALAAVNLARQTGITDYLFVYGVGDHGGGPTRRDLAMIRQAQRWPLFPKLVFSTAKAFFERVNESLSVPPSGATEPTASTSVPMPPSGRLPGLPAPTLPVYGGELNTVFSGCYSSQSRVKQLNRDSETLLTRAEAWQAVAHAADASLVAALPPTAIAGVSTPTASAGQSLLEQAWQKHLFNQFHDILPGSGVPATYQYALGVGQQVRAAAEAVEDRALQALIRQKLAYFPPPVVETIAQLKPKVVADRVSVNPDWVRPVAVANVLPWRRSESVRLDIWDPPAGAEQAVLIDPEGRLLLTQRLRRHEEWGHQQLRVAFPALDLPALGLRSYAALLLTPPEWEQLLRQQGWQRRRPWADWDPAIDPEDPPGGRGVQGWIDGTGKAHLENQWLAAEVEPGSGAVVHLIDKRTGEDLVPPGQRLGLLEMNLEAPHGMSAWKIGPFAARQPLTNGAALRLESNGPVEATVVAQQTYHESRFELCIRLTATSRRLEYHLAADWAERSDQGRPAPTLQVAFPVAVATRAAKAEARENAGVRAETADAKAWAEAADEAVAQAETAAEPAAPAKPGVVEALYEIPFGAIRRPADGMEVPGQRFAALGRLLVLNRGRYGFSATVDDDLGDLGADGMDRGGRGYRPGAISVLRMTLLRATHDPDPLPDHGHHEIEWAIELLSAEEQAQGWASTAAAAASEYQYPVQGRALAGWEVAGDGKGPGSGDGRVDGSGEGNGHSSSEGRASSPASPQDASAELSWLELDPAGSVAWSVLKSWEGVPPAGDGGTTLQTVNDSPLHSTEKARSAMSTPTDWVIRLYEVDGQDRKARLKLGPALLAERGLPTAVRELDLLERPVDPPAAANVPGDALTLDRVNGILEVQLHGYEIKTILLHWDSPASH
ncbi:MAG: hypothetical protein IMX01_01335 [Limnochordaceae bacterium]|nr:hypothetical protein [Limnochordaceae bacterium]